MKMEDFIDNYKNNFTTYALVFKFMKARYRFANIMVVLLSVSTYLLVIAIPSAIINYKIIKIIGCIYAFILILSIVAVGLFDYSARKIIYKKYKIRSSDGAWRPQEFNKMQTEMIIDYLKTQKVYTEEKLERLAANLKDSIERKKSPSIWVAGVFLALFTPLWNQYMTYIFKMTDGVSWIDVSITVLVTSTGIGLFSLFIGGIKKIIFVLQDLFLMENQSVIGIKLLEHIQSIQLAYEEPEEPIKKIIIP
ncbi:hypothetical protein [Paenibacillus wenxiniae]|uniref:DUF4231 domain-containing protein n=1 Tax=Paenibacillus wenxiniae TaxID=1636843 RepID=A0ABW4RLE5_9BACL